MKKILLATTALVLSAGIASANDAVKLSGTAWMGLRYANNVAPGANKASFVSRARVKFTMSGQTDTGLAFGASFEAHNSVAATAEAANSGSSVFISGAFGKLSMGDVDSALEATWFRTRHIGVLENSGGSRTTALGSSKTAALYEYSMDGLKVALGAGQVGSKDFSLGVQYKVDGYGVAVGYEKTAASKHILLSAEGSFDATSVRAFAGRRTTGAVKANQYGLDVHTKFDAIGIQFRAKRDFAKETHLGLGATYDLGGGAMFGASINQVKPSGAGAAVRTADVGVSFKF
ncbi:MAG: porin [Roseinatronobacter sp.]